MPLRSQFPVLIFKNSGEVQSPWISKLFNGEGAHNAYRFSLFHIFASPEVKNIGVQFTIEYSSRVFDTLTKFGSSVECRLFPAEMITQIIRHNNFSLEVFAILALAYQNLSQIILTHPQMGESFDWSHPIKLTGYLKNTYETVTPH